MIGGLVMGVLGLGLLLGARYTMINAREAPIAICGVFMGVAGAACLIAAPFIAFS